MYSSRGDKNMYICMYAQTHTNMHSYMHVHKYSGKRETNGYRDTERGRRKWREEYENLLRQSNH